MPISDASLRAKDVQRLLWAAGEARGRQRDHTRRTVHRRAVDTTDPTGDGDFFTEWQPSTP